MADQSNKKKVACKYGSKKWEIGFTLRHQLKANDTFWLYLLKTQVICGPLDHSPLDHRPFGQVSFVKVNQIFICTVE